MLQRSKESYEDKTYEDALAASGLKTWCACEGDTVNIAQLLYEITRLCRLGDNEAIKRNNVLIGQMSPTAQLKWELPRLLPPG